MRALITAGGSNQLRPLTHTKNKHLLELANKPLILHALEQIAKAGINEIGIITEENDTELRNFLGDGSHWGVSLTYIPQVGGALGLAHAIYCAQNFIKRDPFMLYLGDNIIYDDIAEIRRKFEESGHNSLLTLARIPRPERFGVPVFDQNYRIIRVEERPIQPKSPYAVAGLYFYDASVYDAFHHLTPSSRGNYEISDLHTWLIQNGYNVHWHEINRWWKDRGSPSDLLEGNTLALSRLQESSRPVGLETSVSIQGNVKIGPNTKIGGRTVIRGPVAIGDYCLIKDSYIGPYTSIGDRVEVHNGHIEHSIVHASASITASKKIIDSIIGEDSIVSDAAHGTPRGNRFIVGENSSISI